MKRLALTLGILCLVLIVVAGLPAKAITISGNVTTEAPTGGGDSGNTDWGDIGGTLGNQSDLQTALDGKEPSVASGNTSQYWRGDKTWQILAGGGDMLKATYDTDLDSVVDMAENVTGWHSHANLAILDLIEEAFTTALKTSYDWLVTNLTAAWKTSVDWLVTNITPVWKGAVDQFMTSTINGYDIADNVTLTAADVGAIASSIVDAKGDIIATTADNTPVRLAYSAVDGHVLTIDTTTATGWKWAAGGGYTNEEAQDAVGGILTNTPTVAWTYNDGANTISADAVTEGIEDIVGAMAGGTESGITVAYNDGTGMIDYTVTASGGDVVYTATPGDTAINSVTDVTVVTRDVTGVAAGDQLILEADFIILNNSTLARIYVITTDFDAAFDVEHTTGSLATSTTLMHPFHIRSVLSVRSSSSAFADFVTEGQLIAGIASGTDTTMAATHLRAMGWGTTGSDLTGTVTVVLKIRSANATATQTLRLISLTIRKVTPS